MQLTTTIVVLATVSWPLVFLPLFAVPDQVARWIPGHFVPLGADGYGRSDTRENLRSHFEIDAPNIVVTVLRALLATGEAKQKK